MRNKKTLAVLLCAAMAAGTMTAGTTMTACAEEEKVLTIGWAYEPSTLDPARAEEDASYRITHMTTEALLRYVDGEVEPGCAESYEASDDKMEYTFHLREDSVFSDGTPITAETFRYSLLRLLDPEVGNEACETGYVIKNGLAYNTGECEAEDLGIEVVDDYTLKLTLEYPTYPVQFTRWEFSPVSEEASEEYGIAYGAEAENMLTNGPFTVTEWVHDSEVVLEKNENYWNADAINLDKIVCVINATGDTAVDMLMTDALDVADMSTQIQADTMVDQGFELYTSTSGYQCLHINHTGKTEETALFLSNVNFRKALNYAIDRDALVATSYTTDIAATRAICPDEDGVDGLFQEEYPYEGWSTGADTEKAKEYLELALEELGKTADEIPTFTFLCYDSNNNMIALNAVMDMWNKALGINCEIDAQPIQNMIQKMYNGEYDFWKGAVSREGIDALSLFDYYQSEDGTFNYSDEAYDALYDAALNAQDWQERKDDIFALEQDFCENVIDLLLTWQGTYAVYSPNVTGITAYDGAVDVTYADIAE
jgi:oligopeptide transport system substrate-binding protein